MRRCSSLHPATFIVIISSPRGLLAVILVFFFTELERRRTETRDVSSPWLLNRASILLSNIFLQFLYPNSNQNQIYFVVSVNVQRQKRKNHRRIRRKKKE
ncbi:hypothetical protein Bca101_058969 [Brassica carinata]